MLPRPNPARRAPWTRLGCAAATLLLGACGLYSDDRSTAGAAVLAGGDPHRGEAAIRKYGCGSCHTIAGVPGADSRVAPPLNGIASRMYVAGMLPNTPANLAKWIEDPPAVDSLTAMPKLGVSRAEARDIAAYLYGLK